MIYEFYKTSILKVLHQQLYKALTDVRQCQFSAPVQVHLQSAHADPTHCRPDQKLSTFKIFFFTFYSKSVDPLTTGYNFL